MSDLIPGGNQALPDGVLSIRVPGPFDLSVLITGDGGKVTGDGDFVFFNQPSAPGTQLRGDTVTVDPRRLRSGASRVTVVVSPAETGTPLGRLPAPLMSVTGSTGTPLAHFAPERPTSESVLLLAEIYRRGDGWKIRALGQGYADGLAGVARDFGIDVADDGAAPGVGAGVGAGATPGSPAATAPGGLPAGPFHAFVGVVNAQRAGVGTPPVAPDARLATAAQTHAASMAAQNRLDAGGPDGTSVFQQVTTCGYAYLFLAEDLVSGPRTPAAFVDYCLSQEPGRSPLLDATFTQVGLGQATGARTGDVYWTALWAQPFTTDGLARTATEVIALTNAERARARLAPLTGETRLTTAAQAHSADMVARDFYSHTTPEGHEPWDRAAAAGCTHRGIGENIACGQRSAAEVVDGWMNSPGHRANILKPDFTHIGIGYATGGRAGTYWTQLFGMSR
ncbi:CAP domain-containing protein [Streptomyces sp. N2-109]|uniref:CAP domain-containing protein n=1 Tax=Streptomyces gossypii TaxID=2883101 RepID=A0ABT2JP85_9ACTN|nr:CAP domain-containing protein [Streptomyces gossypii]MCT2589636.1 CAP domain-containing protein [Streptomyces gossypii]